MACPDPEVLARFLSEETDPADTSAVQAHLEACPECRGRVDAERALDEALGLLPPLAPYPSARACLDVATLAALLDGALPEGERPRVEGHLAGCGSCLDALVSAAERPFPAPRPVPEALAAEARALVPAGGARGAARPVRVLSRPAWRVAATVAALALAGSVMWPRKASPPLEAPYFPKEAFVPKGPAFGHRPLLARADRLAGGSLRIDPGLAQALRDYDARPTDEARVLLLQVLADGPLKIPASLVTSIEVHPEAVASIHASPSGEVRVTLLRDGHLLIEEP
jgi:hypothetical protein